MLKAKFFSKDLFSALKIYRNTERYTPAENEYVCNACGQQFSAYWNLRANKLNSWVARGNFVRCPYCDQYHGKNVLVIAQGEQAPIAVTIGLHEFKSKVTLSVDYCSQAFGEKSYKITVEQGKELFLFDFSSQKVWFQKTVCNYYVNDTHYERTALAPINENTAGTIIQSSILRHINYYSCLYADKNLSALNKAFYQAIKGKFQANGDQAANLYVNTKGLPDGLFLRAILNYACKMADMDKTVSREAKIESKYILQGLNTLDLTTKQKRIVIICQQEGMDGITAAVKAAGLPEKNALRQIIATGGSVSLLSKTISVFDNFDYALRFYKKMRARKTEYLAVTLRFIRYARKVYGDGEILSFIEKTNGNEIHAIFRLLKKLDKEQKRLLSREKIRINRLHDALSLSYQRQCEAKYEKIALKAPEHVVKRLAMQLCSVKFYLPDNSLELLRAGHILHNCVASYTDRINSNKAHIVFMTDDNGKLFACINVAKNTILEAKLFGNKPVRSDAAINAAVLNWAIATQDIAVAGENEARQMAS